MPESPNVLLIITDQLRADALGCYGNGAIATPHIDRLADEGVRFEHCCTPYPVCTPARYSLFTGVHPHVHRGLGNHSTPLATCRSFVQQFRDAGYRTTAVGKMHFTPTYLDLGFERMVLAEQNGPGRYEDDYHRELTEAGLADVTDLIDQEQAHRAHAPEAYWRHFGALPSNLPEGWDSTSWIADKAMAELGAWREGGGNLLTVSFIHPHHPFDPPEPWFSRHRPDETDPLPGWQDAPDPDDLALHEGYFPHKALTLDALRRVTAAYYGMIEQIDHHIGRMLAALTERGMLGNTCVAFVSDHGEYLGSHHLLLKSNRMYEPLLRVPLIIRPPDPTGADAADTREPSRAVVDPRPASLIDLPRTLGAAAGVEPAPTAEGEDLLQPRSGRAFVFATAGRGEVAVRSATHKLLWDPNPEQVRFFDLQADPLERDGRGFDPRDPQFGRHYDAMVRWLVAFMRSQPSHLADESRALATPAHDPTEVRAKLDAGVRAWLAGKQSGRESI